MSNYTSRLHCDSEPMQKPPSPSLCALALRREQEHAPLLPDYVPEPEYLEYLDPADSPADGRDEEEEGKESSEDDADVEDEEKASEDNDEEEEEH
ncbi:hypothetical protein Tco_0784867 [Tanacetum coccineum]